MKHSKNIKISGAGISGMSAAIVLAKEGFSVDIYEKRSTIGSFFKKNIHSIRNYYEKDDIIKSCNKLGIKISNVYPIFKEIRFSPSLGSIEIYSKDKPLFYNFIRGSEHEKSFDAELFEEAKRRGVKFHFNEMLLNDDVDIVATGAPGAKAIACGEHYKLDNNTLPLDSIYVFFDNNYAPSGYVYINPFGNEFSIVLVIMNIDSEEIKENNLFNIKEKFNNFKKQNSVINNILKNAIFQNEISGYAFYDSLDNLPNNSKLYVGEAAGLLDAAMGFGTYYAISSGYFMAQSLITGKDYRQLYKEAFGEELEMQYNRRKKIDKFNNNDYNKIINKLIANFGDKIEISKYKEFKKSLY